MAILGGPQAREHLVKALEADLVGPFAPERGDGEADEVLPIPPSRWYLTGFLAPLAARDPEDPTAQEELALGGDDDEDETSEAEPEPKIKKRFAASMGLSVLLPPAATPETVSVRVEYAEYLSMRPDAEEGRRSRPVWQRYARPPVTVTLPLDPTVLKKGLPVVEGDALVLVGHLKPADAPGLAKGTRALAIFLVNRRQVGEKARQDERFIFQVRLTLEYTGAAGQGLVPRPNNRDEDADDWDDRVADLQFRDSCEYAVGHGVSVDVPAGQAPVREVRTTWLPQSEVRRVMTRIEPSVETSMDALGALGNGDAARQALLPLVDRYGTWVDAQREVPLQGLRRGTRDELVKQAHQARERIRKGIELLASDPLALEAFRLANQAMAAAARQRSPERYQDGHRPSWFLFQLAFVLLNLPGVASDTDPDRETVELIFFPTGGGKSEAYLGLIAFTLVLRRLRGQPRPDRGLGVAVILRYTLRLLTLDQLGRAATLICALEKIRREQPDRLGDVRFSVGLYVGKRATANTMADVASRVVDYKNGRGASPCPLTSCPWCGEPLVSASLTLQPERKDPEELVVGCARFSCEFSAGKNRDGLPVMFVDEQIYRELPSFLLATVDKFALLPWRGETGMLFGRVQSRSGRRFHGPMAPGPKTAELLPQGLMPPELIVQDELHLISGPLGTMVGLYETAIEALSTRTAGGQKVRPKVIASTATVRRAQVQVQALFARKKTAIFPPPGVDPGDNYFAQVDRDSPGRLYVGVAAPGRAARGILLRSYVTLLAAAEKLYERPVALATGKSKKPAAPVVDGAGPPPDQPADGFMTLVGYFNSLRELGGMRRLVEDEVGTRCTLAEERKPLNWKSDHPWFRRRSLQREPLELTSREHTSKVSAAKARLALRHAHEDHADVVLASNMISVGIDVDRLGLMVIAGQPKTTSEYIQASSRVGRQAKYPGLVVTCFNVHKPRDRSHYERFAAYHESFYRFVEAMSLTPFSGPAVDRGLAGTFVAMARLLDTAMTPADAVMAVASHPGALAAAAAELATRAAGQPSLSAEEAATIGAAVRARAEELGKTWERLIKRATEETGSKRHYSPWERTGEGQKSLLLNLLETPEEGGDPDELRFIAPTSMREVEPQVHLWLQRDFLGEKR